MFIHVAVNGKIPSFLWPNNPVLGHHHNLFTHSPVDGHLGCFRFFVCCEYSCCERSRRFWRGQMFSVVLSIYLEAALLRPAVAVLHLWELPDCSPRRRGRFVSSSTVWELWFLLALPSSCWLSTTASLVGVKWPLILVLICVSWQQMMLSIFSCAYWPFPFSLGKNSVSISYFSIGYLSFSCGFLRVLQIFYVDVPYQVYGL